MYLLAMEQQDIPLSAGRGQAPQSTQSVEATPSAPASTDVPPPSGGPFGSFGMILVMLVPMVLLMIWMNRSQTKKQREFESKLKKGDRVVTSGGLVGRVAEISPSSKYVKLEITSGVKVEMLKTAIQGLDTADAAATAATASTVAASDKNTFEKADKSDKDKSDKNKK